MTDQTTGTTAAVPGATTQQAATGTDTTLSTATTQQAAATVQETATQQTTAQATQQTTQQAAPKLGADGKPIPEATQQAAQTTQQHQAGVWPENWRQQIAGEDKSLLTQLERFADPAAIFKQNRELQAKLSSGQVRTALPEGAT